MEPLRAAARAGEPALLLDLDGTLIDSSPAHALAFESALRDLSLEMASPYSAIAGMTTADAAGVLGVPPGLVSTFVRLKRDHYLSALREGAVVAVLGAPELVSVAHTRGWAVAVVTSASRESVAAVWESMHWLRPVDHVVAGDDGLPGKPSPRPYLRAMQLLARTPLQCVGFEDSSAGLEALAAAGVAAIQVPVNQAAAQDVLSEAVAAIDRLPQDRIGS